MSPSRLAVAPRPDPARIAALAAAIALNLAALLVLARPLPPPMRALWHRLTTTPQVVFIEPPPALPPPPPITLKPLPHAPPVAVRAPTPTSAPPVVVPSTEGTQAMPKPMPPGPAPVAPPAPVEASLAYRASPLQYPPQALRQHLQGTVLLRVLVDEAGQPVQVEIEHGSGSSLLDHSAREQVLAHWRFQPAIVDGHAVRAWAHVPVSFALRDL